jgi:hypothetical protein
MAVLLLAPIPAKAQMPSAAAPAVTQQQFQALLDRLAAQDARIQQLESKVQLLSGGNPAAAAPEAASAAPAATQEAVVAAPAPAPVAEESHDLAMAIPHGPVLHMRGFFDFNYGVGSIANPLVFPISVNGCGTCGNPITPPHNAFQAGEFDLFITSKLSDNLSFLAEVVLGPDDTNVFGPDIERYELTYKANRYFSVKAGRFHTSLGYYNTAYHHGNWFSTAEGRPIMYLFEDSGGILPMHMVGVNLTGEVPHTESLGLHWVAELGNGNSSNPGPEANSVQNFYSDRNYKATNFAVYLRPQFLSGLQMGGSWYHDGLNPSQALTPLPLPEIRQNIESAYAVYFSSDWEFMTEGVMLSNHLMGTPEPYRSPMAYTQIARKFGMYKPYVRYQYVRDNVNDPINLLRGTYYGPSIGMRVDLFDYAALKAQFNHLYQSGQFAGNGFDTQLAFTF